MRDGRVFVRTIAGLKRGDVLWRHVDAEWCDPLELNAASRIGVPGLIDAIRAGGVAVENMPGAGLLESRALLGFLPALARRLIGEDLRDAEHRHLVVRPAERARRACSPRSNPFRSPAPFAIRRPASASGRGVVGGELRAPTSARALRAAIDDARRRLRRPGHRAAVDDAALGGRPAGAAPVRAARLRRRDARTAGA